MNTYSITPANGEAAYDLQADRYEFDATSGRHMFYVGEELVGNLLNVSVRKEPAA